MANVLLGNLIITLGVDATQLYAAKLKIAQSMQQLANGANGYADKVEKSGRRMLNFYSYGYRATMMLTAPLVLLGKAVGTTFAEYETSMTKIIALTGATESAVKEWSQSLLDMSGVVSRGPNELAEAMYFVSSSGFKGAEALQIVKQAAMGAAAGLGETKDVANLVTSAMNAYRQTGLGAGEVMDILVAAVREGKGEATDFARTIGSVIPIAAELGVGFDQVSGAMAAMTLTGASAANSATYLRGILNQLLDPSRGVDEAMENIGTSAQELRDILRQKGLMAALTRIRDLTKEWGEDAIGEIFPNIRALIGVLSLMGENLEYNEGLMARVSNSTGDAARAFEKGANTLERRWNSALANAQVAAITFGKALKEVVMPALKWTSEAVKTIATWFDGLSPAVKNATLKFAGLLAISGPLYLVLGFLKGNILPGLIRVFTWLINPAGTIVRLFISMKVALKSLQTLLIANAWNPILLVIAGMAAAFWGMRNAVKAAVDELYPLRDVLVAINGEMKSLVDLKPEDFSTMTSETIFDVWDMARQSLSKFQKDYDDITAAIAATKAMPVTTFSTDLLGGALMKKSSINALLLKQQEALNNIEKTKQAMVSLGQMTEVTQQELIAAAERRKKAEEEAAAAYDKITMDPRIKTMTKELGNEMAVVDKKARILLGTYDASKEKISILTKYIEDLAEKQRKSQRYIKGYTSTMADWIRQLNEAKMDVFKKELESVALKGQLLGDMYNENAEKAKILESRIGELIGDLRMLEQYFGKNSVVAMALRINIEELVETQKKELEAARQLESARAGSLLMRQADAYGTMAAKIEYVNFQLEKAKKDVTEYLRLNPNIKFDDEQLQRYIQGVHTLEMETLDLQNIATSTYLNDVYAATGRASDGMAILSQQISNLRGKMELLSAQKKAGDPIYSVYGQQVAALEGLQLKLELVDSAFEDFYSSIIEGGKNMAEVLQGIFKNMAARIVREIFNQLMAKMAIRAASLILGGGANAAWQAFNVTGGIRFAEGGIVPPGFPRDSYPARLSSAEAVIPLEKLDSLTGGGGWEGEVVFHIGQDELTGILKKATKKNSLY